jgi:hypothetical protein
MRFQLVILGILLPGFAFAAIKNVTDLMKESQGARAETAKELSFEKKSKRLKDFEINLNATIKAYEKDSPTEGGDDEEKVVKFSYRFEPLFALASQKAAGKESCAKTKHQIEFEDKSGKAEDAKLSEAAEESLKWLELLCK